MSLPADLPIEPTGPLHGEIQPPGSKSITNRALVCAALAAGESLLTGALDSEDTQVMIDSLRRLGLAVEHDTAAATLRVVGDGGRFPRREAELFVGNSGTTIRFLTAALAVGEGRFVLDGVPRMRQRPIGDLLAALAALGVDARSLAGDNCPPVEVRAAGLPGGQAEIRGDVSSQFLSGLLMAAPYARAPLTLRLATPLVSRPYVDMTLAVMRSFGVAVQVEEPPGAVGPIFHIDAPRAYRGASYAIEPDASAASYFWAAAAITGGAVRVRGLTRGALQGDVAFCDCLAALGCTVDYDADGVLVAGPPQLRGGHTFDMNAISDTVQTLAAVALFADGPTTVTHVGHIRHKETDRIGDLARELRKLGAAVDERDDGLTIHPRELRGAPLDTYNDHRMAMSLALVGLRVPGVVIRDPGCTVKTYPHFFADLDRLAGSSRDRGG